MRIPWYTGSMFQISGFAVLALQCLTLACSGLRCDEVGDLKDPERVSILRQRIAAGPAVFLVRPPLKDTLRISLESEADSVCSVRLRIARYRSDVISLNGFRPVSRTILHSDTLGINASCPNENCSREYECSYPEQVRGSGGPDGLHRTCDGEGLWGSSGRGSVGSCDHSLIELGKDAGGILFGPEDQEHIPRIAKDCPTDVRSDEWIPLLGDSLEIRTREAGKMAIRKLALSDVLGPGRGSMKPGPH